jgi:hypothetical protein
MRTRNARTMRIGLPALLVAVVVTAGAAPPVLGQFHLPRVLPAKKPTPANAEAETPGRLKAPSWMSLKVPKVNPPQQKLGTEVAGGVGAAAACTFKDYARRHWGWR